MQTRGGDQACRSALSDAKHPDWTIVPEIMIPLVGEVKELAFCERGRGHRNRRRADRRASGADMHYKVGTMIEIPRAALTADEIAKAG